MSYVVVVGNIGYVQNREIWSFYVKNFPILIVVFHKLGFDAFIK
jgi:hypothetical protein